jgi:hypothetical protein
MPYFIKKVASEKMINFLINKKEVTKHIILKTVDK